MFHTFSSSPCNAYHLSTGGAEYMMVFNDGGSSSGKGTSWATRRVRPRSTRLQSTTQGQNERQWWSWFEFALTWGQNSLMTSGVSIRRLTALLSNSACPMPTAKMGWQNVGWGLYSRARAVFSWTLVYHHLCGLMQQQQWYTFATLYHLPVSWYCARWVLDWKATRYLSPPSVWMYCVCQDTSGDRDLKAFASINQIHLDWLFWSWRI